MNSYIESERELDELDLLRLAQRDGIEMHRWEMMLAAAAIKAQLGTAIDALRGVGNHASERPVALCKSAAGWLADLGVEVDAMQLYRAACEIAKQEPDPHRKRRRTG